MINCQCDVLLSVVNEKIECAIQNQPVNFSFNLKTNSQEIEPVQKITWSITGWRREIFLNAYKRKECATYAGNVGFYPISRIAGHIIKTADDLRLAEALYHLKH